MLKRIDIKNLLKNSLTFCYITLLMFFCFAETISLNGDVLDSFDSKPSVTKETAPKTQDESQPLTKSKEKDKTTKDSETELGKSTSKQPTTGNTPPVKSTNKNLPAENAPSPEKAKPSKHSSSVQDKKLPINLSSDGVSALKEQGTIELEKNVLITQGDLSLKSNKARVYFINDGNEVEKIIADGDVQVDKFDEVSQKPIHASGKKMTFLNDKQIIILEGNAKISRGKDNMRGNMITYDIKTGQIKAEKIETVVYPDENPIKKPGSE